jgi:hypothetical protein
MDHKTEECQKKTPLCTNCKQEHPSNSMKCPRLIQKTIENNKHIIDILVGEGIIKNVNELFKERPQLLTSFNQPEFNFKNNDTPITEIIDRIVNEKHNNITDEFNRKISNCNKNIETLISEFKDTNGDNENKLETLNQKIHTANARIDKVEHCIETNQSE